MLEMEHVISAIVKKRQSFCLMFPYLLGKVNLLLLQVETAAERQR